MKLLVFWYVYFVMLFVLTKKTSILVTIYCVIIMWCYQLVFKFNENVVFATYAIYHSILASNITIKKDKNSKISKITIDH